MDNLLTNVTLLDSLGEIITLQIDLSDIKGVERYLQERFQDSRGLGFYTENSIIIQHQDQHTNYALILDSLIDIVADPDAIDGVTALISIPLKSGDQIEASVQIDDTMHPPRIMATADTSLYFELAQSIQMSWSLAKSHFNIRQ